MWRNKVEQEFDKRCLLMKILIPSENYPEKYWLKYDHEKNPDHLEFLLGKEVHVDNGPIVYVMKGKVSLAAVREYDYLFSDGPDVVSDDVARILVESCPLDVQLLPAVLVVNGGRYGDYFALNVLNKYEAFDLSRCNYVPLINSMPDGPKKFKTIHLKGYVPNFSIFRAVESRFNIVLSDSLAVKLEGRLVKGVQFVSGLDGL